MALNAPLRPTHLFRDGQLLRFRKRRSAALKAYRQIIRARPRRRQVPESLEEAPGLQWGNPIVRCQMDDARRKLCNPEESRAELEHVQHSGPIVAERTRHEVGVVYG